jgi:hypothetical protein
MTREVRLFPLIVTATLLPLGAIAADTAVKPAASKAAADARWCSMPTSPRLQRKDDDCASAREWTRSHSNDDLARTGQGNAADALKRIDPIVR